MEFMESKQLIISLTYGAFLDLFIPSSQHFCGAPRKTAGAARESKTQQSPRETAGGASDRGVVHTPDD